MARRSNNSSQIASVLLTQFLKLPFKVKVGLVVLAVVVGLVLWGTGAFRPTSPEGTKPANTSHPSTTDSGDPSATPGEVDANPLVNLPPPPARFPTGSQNVVFCFWNVENLFDDVDNKRRHPDEEYDSWFVRKPEDRQRKYERLVEVLLKINDGKGPDVLACAEVESVRAADMLREALNAALPAGVPKYEQLAMKDLDAGRHIATCVISRITIDPWKTRLVGSRMRILQVVLKHNGHELMLVASHWTSQLSDKGDGGENKGRAKYANTIHDLYAAELKRNAKLDFLVCGDFNDSPESDSVRNHLYLTGDAKLVTADSNPPRLFGVLSGKNPAEFGTHYYNKALIYDHIGLSPGMFDNTGWGYGPDSLKVPAESMMRFGTRGRRPWRYGTEKDDARGRGYSDHFPVVLTLKVAP